MKAEEESKHDMSGTIDTTQIQSLQFTVNNLKTEVDYQKKMFSVQKLQLLDTCETKLRNLTYEVEVQKMNMDQFASK